MRNLIGICAAGLLAVSVAGCGSSPTDRAISGGLIGAGLGAGTAAVTGGSIGTGVLIGGLGGAVIGGVTSDRDIDAGRPVWKR
ncbi:hypothetical protein D3874_06885 [Oleomonas cavernae]|uniref:Glycine zipper domain-containing protein n=1 Tax=Oleomonas cavernae TaxID=2320859 RepID=A0A418W9X7_9PROT|nr:hypothetical protein [Oleomonas cavernae]RJF86776.1 hypothetical protein D3874_06885 [Oleomonas cavernae]